MSATTPVDLFSPATQFDPHPLFRQLRQESGLRRIELPSGQDAWLITRYDDVRQALRDPALSKGGLIPPTGVSPIPQHVRTVANQHMLTADPPDHTRLRRLVAAAFTPRRVAELRPRIEQITDELLDRIEGVDQVDLIDALAFPLPIQVICELLGVPVADQDDFRRWSNTIIAGVAAGEALAAASEALVRYLLDLIARKRVEPGEDIISALIAVQEDGDRLTADELSSTVFLLLIAGHETTVNLIGNGAYLLLTHPDQAAALRADPGLLPGAVEEFLRYESPVQNATFRIAAAPTCIGGQDIAAGEPVLVSLLSANRDEGRFADAARLDVTRRDNPHLAFGHGIHYCLGAPLARVEGQVALGKLLLAYPEMSWTGDDLEWRMSALMHGLAGLPVRPGRRAA